MPPTDNLAQLQQQVRAVHVRHADRPHVLGPFTTAFALWRKLYEARAAFNDQNPAFAARLLPRNASPATRVPGLPLVPAGVRWAVDDSAPGYVTVTVDVAAVVKVSVKSPTGAVLAAAITPGTTRQTASFLARLDGLYELTIYAGASRLTTVYVPVQRRQFLAFRQLSRELAFAFDLSQNPAATSAYCDLLAVLYAADAAAATGQPELFAALMAAAAAVEPAPTPTALFPRL